MNEVALPGPERGFHPLRRAGVEDANPRPVDVVAVRGVLAAGLRTGDIAAQGEQTVGTRAMGDAVVARLRD